MLRNLLFVCLVAAMHSSCRPTVPFVWADTFPIDERAIPPYRIQAGEEIEITVWDQPQISRTYIVRQDGYITIPLVGELHVAGLTPVETADAISAKLEGDIVHNARVAVILQRSITMYVSILGEVENPGQFVLKPGDTILDILALAGGLSEFAEEDSIYIFRHDAKIPRIRFDYDRLTTLKTGGIRFELQDGDVILVE